MIPNRFVYLDFLRFAFALIVFFGHAKALLVLENFQLAVDYFFILSGFVLTHAYKDKVSSPGFVKKFTRDRIARLYPLHLVTIFILMFMSIWFTEITGGQWIEQGWAYQDGRTNTLALNLLLLNNVGLTPGGPSWNAPAWSISVEFWINLLLAVLAVTIRRFILAFCVIAFLLCYSVLFVKIGGLGYFFQNIGYINTGLLRGLAGMSAGMLCYAAYRRLLPAAIRFKPVVVGTAIALTAVQFWLIAGGVKFTHSEFLIVPVSGVTVLAVALAESMRVQSRIDGILEWLGECSYSIYMTHWMVLVFINYFMIYIWKVDIDIKNPVQFATMVIVVLAISRISFNYIEKPGKKFIKGLGK